MKNILKKIDKFFHVSERGSTIGRELVMGLMVFLAMVYMLPVNAGILGQIPGANPTAIFIATALCAAIACLVMGFVGNFPLALCAGMGMNSFLAYTVCLPTQQGGMGFSWQQALTLTFVSGTIFFVITLTPLRKWIINAIPNSLKSAISAGLGAFIAMIGLKSCGLINFDAGIPTLTDFANPTVLLGAGAILLCFALSHLKGIVGKLSIVITMVATATIGLILNSVGVPGMPSFDATFANIGENFATFGKHFGNCFDFGGAFTNVSAFAVVFSMVFVTLFDATGTLIAVGKDSGIIDQNGQVLGGKKVLMADATAALLCGIFGTSTVTPLAESTVGTSNGAKTGITAIVAGLLFVVATLLYPVFSVFAHIDGLTPLTSFALVTVGAMMFKNLKDIDWNDAVVVLTSFVIIIMMVLTYSISDGLGIGLIVYSILMLVTGKGKQVSPAVYVVSAVFLANFVLNALI